MADVKKTVEVNLKATGDLSKSIDELGKKFQGMLSSIENIQANLGGFSKSVSGIKFHASFVPGMEAIKSLDKIKLPDLSDFAKGLDKVSKQSGKKSDLTTLFDSIKMFSGLKVPALLPFAQGLEKLAGASSQVGPAATVIRGLHGSLAKLAELNLPNLPNIAAGVEKLFLIGGTTGVSPQAVSGITNLISALSGLNNLKVPDLKKLSEGMTQLRAFADPTGKIAGNLGPLVLALDKFKSINLPGLDKFANGMKTIQSVDIQKIVQNIAALAKGIEGLDRSGQLKSFATLASDLRNLGGNISSNLGPLSQMQNQFDRMSTTVANAGNKVKGFGERLGNYLQYRIIADSVMFMERAFGSSIDVIREFDQSLKDLQAITSATDVEVGMMAKTIIDVAETTKFSAGQVAEGMKILGQAGFSATESMQTIRAVSDLATGTLSDMAQTVDLVSTALRVFDISTTQSSHVADVFATAINKSKLDIEKLRTSFNYVGPVAKEVGVSFEESAASLMVLANSGLRASTMGTSLRSLFSDLADPPVKLAAAINKAGFSIEEFDPRTQGLQAVLSKLNIVVKDAGVAFDIFGKRGAGAVLTLKEAGPQLTQMMGLLSESGSAAKMAEIQMEGLGVMIKNLKDKVELLGISLGKAGINDLMRGLVNVSRDLVDALSILINSGIGGVITKFGLLVISTAGVLTIVGKLAEAYKTLTMVMALNITAGASVLATGVQISATTIALGTTLNFYKGILAKVATSIWAVVTAQNAMALAAVMVYAPFVALGGLFVFLARSIDDFKKSSAEAAEKAANFKSLSDGMTEYATKISKLKDGSEELKNANIGLRTELFKAAESNKDIAVSATLAAKSIDAFNGTIKDTSAIKQYTKDLKDLGFKNVTKAYNDAITNIASQSSRINRTINDWKTFGSLMGDSLAGAGKAALDFMSLDFSKSFKGFGEMNAKMKTETQRLFDANMIAKQLEKGMLSWESYSKYVAEVTSHAYTTVIHQERDLVNSFKDGSLAAIGMLSELEKLKNVSLKLTDDQFKKLAASEGVAADKLDALVTAFHNAQKMQANMDNATLGSNLVKEFENGKNGLVDFISTYRAEREKLKLEPLTPVQESNVIAWVAERQILSEQYEMLKKNFELRKEQGMNDAQNKEIMFQETQEYNDKVEKLNKRGYDDFTTNSMGKVAVLKKELDARLKYIEDHYKSDENASALSDEAKAAYSRKVRDAMNQVYSANEIRERYETDLKLAKLSTQEKLHDIALMEAKTTDTHGQAEQERYQISLEGHNKEVELAKKLAIEVAKAKDATPENISNAEQKAEQAQIARTEFLRKELVKQITDETKAKESIEGVWRQIYDEDKKNKEDRLKATKTLHDEQYKAERKLKEKLDDLEFKHNEKLKKFREELVDIERKKVQDIAAINASGEEKIRLLEQRGKSDSSIEEENIKVAWNKYREALKLSEEAKKEGDKEKLARSTSLLGETQSLGGNVSSKDTSIDITRATTAQLALNKAQESAITVAEKEKEIQKESREYTKEKANAQRDFQDRIADLKNVYKDTLHAEDLRHQKTMEHHNVEMGKWQEKLEIAKKLIALSTASPGSLGAVTVEKKPVDAGTGKITKDGKSYEYDASTGKSKELKGETVKPAYDASATDTALQNTAEKAAGVGKALYESMKQSASEINTILSSEAEQAQTIAENGFRLVLENGKLIATNQTDIQRQGMKEFVEGAKSASTESFNWAATEAKNAWETIKDDYVNAQQEMSKGVDIAPKMTFPLSEQIKADLREEIHVPITPDTETFLQEFAIVKEAVVEPMKLNIDGSELDHWKDEVSSFKSEDTKVEIKADVSQIEKVWETVQDLDNTEVNVEFNPMTATLDEVFGKIDSKEDASVNVQFTTTGAQDAIQAVETVKKIDSAPDPKVDIKVSGNKDLATAKVLEDGINSKTVQVAANVSGTDEVLRLKQALDSLRSAQIAATQAGSSVQYSTPVTMQGGAGSGGGTGYTAATLQEAADAANYGIDAAAAGSRNSPSGTLVVDGWSSGSDQDAYLEMLKKKGGYADGGSVSMFSGLFQRLSDRLITTGSGTKDDVPALLMKDEFVHKQAAVKKYGVGFMRKLNNLELPQSIVSHFADGGLVGQLSESVVQTFSKGGQVLSLAKRKLEDILGLNLNIGSVNVNQIQDRAEKEVNPVASNMISRMASNIKESIAGFASGGKVDANSVLSVDELNKMKNDYNQQISEANKLGKTEVAAVLMKERDDLLALTAMLKENLRKLEEDHQAKMAGRNEELVTEAQKRKFEYDANIEKENSAYSIQVLNDNIAADKSDYSYEQSVFDRESSFKETVKKLKESLPEQITKYQEDLKVKNDALKEAEKKIETFKKNMIKIEGNWINMDDSIEDMIRENNTSWPMMGGKRGAGKFNEEKYNIALENYKKDYADPLEKIQKELEDMNKNNPQFAYEQALKSNQQAYNKAKSDSDLSRTREMHDRTLSIFNRDSAYQQRINELTLAFKEANQKDVSAYTNDTSNINAQFDAGVNRATRFHQTTAESIKSKALSDIQEAKVRMTGLSGNFKSSVTSAASDINNPVSVNSSNVHNQLSAISESMDIQELLKKLGKGILKFNTGGLVPFIQGAIRGKDSILASLTPEEYVIKAPAVKAFGTSFLDSINNIRIPQFNSGGLVGGRLELNTPTSKVVHALDLSVNGNNYGELSGDPMTIDGFINALQMAKMRS